METNPAAVIIVHNIGVLHEALFKDLGAITIRIHQPCAQAAFCLCLAVDGCAERYIKGDRALELEDQLIVRTSQGTE